MARQVTSPVVGIHMGTLTCGLSDRTPRQRSRSRERLTSANIVSAKAAVPSNSPRLKKVDYVRFVALWLTSTMLAPELPSQPAATGEPGATRATASRLPNASRVDPLLQNS